MTSLRTGVLAITLMLLAMAQPVSGWAVTAGQLEQKKNAESEHAELRKKLNDLKQTILNTESAKHHAEEALASSERAITTTNQRLVMLGEEQRQTEKQITGLVRQQQELERQVQQKKNQLANWLRQQYETGNTDRAKLILSGDDPNRINRDLTYLGYISESQGKLIVQLRDNLAEVEKNRRATLQAKQNLDEITSLQQQQKSSLVKEQTKRADLLKQLSGKLNKERKEADQLQKDEQRLAALVNQLDHLIAQQRKAAKLQQEKRRAAQALEKKRQAKATESLSHREQKTTQPVQITKTPDADDDDGESFQGKFSQLKGHLRLPVKGELIARFGSQRGEGAIWKGLFIRSGEGAEIRSIAPGKVVFADWLRGFGNLIILDHGAQYMSIYGNNQALLKQVGTLINKGDVIATVGNSGGNEQSGLYFELRFQGKPIDPLGWINLK